jgi:hypothetical protein
MPSTATSARPFISDEKLAEAEAGIANRLPIRAARMMNFFIVVIP